MPHRYNYRPIISLLLLLLLGGTIGFAQEKGRNSLGFRKIIQGDSICSLPSFSSRVANTRLSVRYFAAPDHGTVSLTNGGSYLISNGTVIGGVYYKANGGNSVLKQDEAIASGPTIWLSSDLLRMPEPVTQLDIMDITGRKVLSARNSREVKLSLTPGVYLIRAIFPRQTVVCRLTIR
ncbi:hypothetical protein [uncultured Porphyromonas sp.]|uniref:hypothetical protein n=1 Tax=uncultured Porphyromonas sp. TaxID=159274 RepID=UPI002610048A|nr:hypothetical protein [uncultured Porphyromonas sp.]